MADKLKIFVSEHRQEFDKLSAPDELWQKVDAKLEMKHKHWIKSKGLSKFIYIGFGLSTIVVVAYILTTFSPEKETTHKSEAKQTLVAQQGGKSENALTSQTITSPAIEKQKESVVGKEKRETPGEKQRDKLISSAGSPDPITVPEKNTIAKNEPEPVFTGTVNEASENQDQEIQTNQDNRAPSELNGDYHGYIWKGTPCSAIGKFRFPGEVTMDGIMKNTGCGEYANGKVETVWLKGKLTRQTIVFIRNNFKNIYLRKSDGRIVYPVAISHFSEGAGFINYYSGKVFKMTFNDDIELLIVFPEAEPGDRLILDNVIQAIIE